jgi:hypothetical protein
MLGALRITRPGLLHKERSHRPRNGDRCERRVSGRLSCLGDCALSLLFGCALRGRARDTEPAVGALLTKSSVS